MVTLDQPQLFAVLAPNPENRQPAIALDAEVGGALGQRQHRVDHQEDPLREAYGIEETNRKLG